MAKSSFSRPQGPPKLTAAAGPPKLPTAVPAPAPTPQATPAAEAEPTQKELPAAPAQAPEVTNLGRPVPQALPVKRLGRPPGSTNKAKAPAPTPQLNEQGQLEVVNNELQELAATRVEQNLMTAPIGTVLGEIDASDFQMPLIKLMQSLSPLVVQGKFSPGDWVLNNESILWQDGCAEVEITVLNIQKKFRQETEIGDDMGKVFDSAADARAAGLVAFGGIDVGYKPFAIALLAIKQPNGVEGSLFTREYNGVNYALAFWMIAGASYRQIAGKIYTQNNQGNRLAGGTHTGSFKLSAYLEQGQKAPYWAPILEDGEMHEEDFVTWLTEQKGVTS